jgi:hypothetical protein
VVDIIIEAIHNLPDRSLSATPKNLSLFFLILDMNYPSAETELSFMNIEVLGALT